VAQVQADYQDLLATMRREQAHLGTLAPAVEHLHKVTASDAPQV